MYIIFYSINIKDYDGSKYLILMLSDEKYKAVLKNVKKKGIKLNTNLRQNL